MFTLKCIWLPEFIPVDTLLYLYFDTILQFDSFKFFNLRLSMT